MGLWIMDKLLTNVKGPTMIFGYIGSTSRAVADSSDTSVSSVRKDSPQSMVSWYTRGHVGPLSVSNVKLSSTLVKC